MARQSAGDDLVANNGLAACSGTRPFPQFAVDIDRTTARAEPLSIRWSSTAMFLVLATSARVRIAGSDPCCVACCASLRLGSPIALTIALVNTAAKDRSPRNSLPPGSLPAANCERGLEQVAGSELGKALR